MPTAMPGSSSEASELTKSCRSERSWRSSRSRVTSADITATYRGGHCWRVLGGAAIDDIISHGKDPGRGRWPRRLTVAAIVAAVLAVLIAEHLPRDAPPRSHHPRVAACPVLAPPIWFRPSRLDRFLVHSVTLARGQLL